MTPTTTTVTLELPEPRNRSNERVHWAKRQRLDRRYKREVWEAAIQQAMPLADPPEKVRATAHVRVYNLRDEDNLRASLKPVWDALKQRQPVSDSLAWRYVDGMRASWIARGFFVDDDPEHLEIGKVTQEVDRKNRGVTAVLEAEALT